MSNFIKVSNLLNKLASQTPELEFYHFGFLHDLNTSPTNNFNKDAKKGRLFPSLDWIVPDETTYLINEPEKERVKMCLIFSDLQGYQNKGNADRRSLLENWSDLKNVSKRFILLFNRALCELNLGGIDEKTPIREELDAYASDFKTQVLKLNFDLILNGECFEVEDDPLPTLAENCDLENYCFCAEIP